MIVRTSSKSASRLASYFVTYRRTAMEEGEPLICLNLICCKLSFKAILPGFSWTAVPITWRNRRFGEAKLKIKEMGSRYFFICANVGLEKYFSREDFKRK